MTVFEKTLSNRIKDATALLSPILLKDIHQPSTVEEGRANLRKFYGCANGELIVVLRYSCRRSENRAPRWEGSRRNGKWHPSKRQGTDRREPPNAVTSAIHRGTFCEIRLDVDELDNLSEIYAATKSGSLYGASDPFITMNLILGGDDPFLENYDDYAARLIRLLEDGRQTRGGEYNEDVWLNNPSVYSLYSNGDKALKPFTDFYNYMTIKGLNNRWRQLSEQHTRYLHWLLLGPFAPFRYDELARNMAA